MKWVNPCKSFSSLSKSNSKCLVSITSWASPQEGNHTPLLIPSLKSKQIVSVAVPWALGVFLTVHESLQWLYLHTPSVLGIFPRDCYLIFLVSRYVFGFFFSMFELVKSEQVLKSKSTFNIVNLFISFPPEKPLNHQWQPRVSKNIRFPFLDRFQSVGCGSPARRTPGCAGAWHPWDRA